jgi:glycosyltransferase involved in cell wall biosynthesis
VRVVTGVTPERAPAAPPSAQPNGLRILMFSPHPRVARVHYLMLLREERPFAGAEELDILDPAVERSYVAPPEDLPRARRAALFLRNAAAWWWKLRRREYDVLHVQSTSFDVVRDLTLLFLHGLRLSGIPIVRTLHELVMPFREPQRHDRRARWRSRLELGLSSHVIVHDAAIRDELDREFQTRRRAVTIIPNGNWLMFRKYLPDDNDEGRIFRSEEPPRVLFLGIKRHKGLAAFLEAWRMIAAEGHRFQALLTGEIGDPDLRAEAERLPGLAVEAGYVPNEDLWRCFARSSFVVMPYLSGATSAAVHLAYAFKRPVIASDLACFRELVIPGETGIVVPRADPVALKNAIIELGSDPSRCRAMGEAGFGLESSSAYDWNTIAEATVQVYLDARRRQRFRPGEAP